MVQKKSVRKNLRKSNHKSLKKSNKKKMRKSNRKNLRKSNCKKKGSGSNNLNNNSEISFTDIRPDVLYQSEFIDVIKRNKEQIILTDGEKLKDDKIDTICGLHAIKNIYLAHTKQIPEKFYNHPFLTNFIKVHNTEEIELLEGYHDMIDTFISTKSEHPIYKSLKSIRDINLMIRPLPCYERNGSVVCRLKFEEWKMLYNFLSKDESTLYIIASSCPLLDGVGHYIAYVLNKKSNHIEFNIYNSDRRDGELVCNKSWKNLLLNFDNIQIIDGDGKNHEKLKEEYINSLKQ